MEIGKKIKLKIESIAFGGEGVARLDGRVVFVRNVIDDEIVEAEIVEEKKSFLRAKLIKVLKKSRFRTVPPCPYFSNCAGCQYQHIVYEHQLVIKGKQVEETIKRIAKIHITPEPVIPSVKMHNYRRLLEFHSIGEKSGFYAYDNKTLINIGDCLLGEPAINEYCRTIKKGHKPMPSSFRVILDDSGTAHSDMKDKKHILLYHVLGKRFSVPVNSFFQINRSLLETMVETVMDFAGEVKDKVLFDCFSGVGFFSIFLAGKAVKVYGFEEGREANEIAAQNASKNGLNNFISIQGKAEERLPALMKTIIPDAIVLDPPRTGCHPDILNVIGRHKIKKIVYISCNPATFARDMAILAGFGYKLEKLQPLDIFPQTSHIEVVSSISL